MIGKIMGKNWFTIEQDGQEIVLKKCSEEAKGAIVIPDGVTHIGAHSFRECPFITSITIPDSVTSIGDYAFYVYFHWIL